MNYFQIDTYFHAKITKTMHKKTIVEVLQTYGVATSKIKYLMDHQCCYVNGEQLDANQPLKINDYISIDIGYFETLQYPPDPYPLDILYEDDYMLIINKPSGYIVYPETHFGHSTIANFVANYYLKEGLNLSIRHCHRLDKDTTGCLIFAKDMITHSAMGKYFENHQIEKTYWAYVEGRIEEKGTIHFPIGKDRHINGKMVVFSKGKKSTTWYKPLSIQKDRTLIEVKIDTGRTHQIRVHLSTIGHPLVGDRLYGAKTNQKILLHCKTMSFLHPITFQKLYIDAPIPDDFRKR